MAKITDWDALVKILAAAKQPGDGDRPRERKPPYILRSQPGRFALLPKPMLRRLDRLRDHARLISAGARPGPLRGSPNGRLARLLRAMVTEPGAFWYQETLCAALPDLSRLAVTMALRRLRQNGLVEFERDDGRGYFRLTGEGRTRAEAWQAAWCARQHLLD